MSKLLSIRIWFGLVIFPDSFVFFSFWFQFSRLYFWNRLFVFAVFFWFSFESLRPSIMMSARFLAGPESSAAKAYGKSSSTIDVRLELLEKVPTRGLRGNRKIRSQFRESLKSGSAANQNLTESVSTAWKRQQTSQQHFECFIPDYRKAECIGFGGLLNHSPQLNPWSCDTSSFGAYKRSDNPITRVPGPRIAAQRTPILYGTACISPDNKFAHSKRIVEKIVNCGSLSIEHPRTRTKARVQHNRINFRSSAANV